MKAMYNNMNCEEKSEVKKENQENMLKKKERLIQIYIVMYGLLLTCTQNFDKTAQTISLFMLIYFLIYSITYYTAITTEDDNVAISLIKYLPKLEAINHYAEVLSRLFGLTITIYLSQTIHFSSNGQQIPLFANIQTLSLMIAASSYYILYRVATHSYILKKVFTISNVRKKYVAGFSLIFLYGFSMLIQALLHIPHNIIFINIIMALSAISLAYIMAKSLIINSLKFNR
jgi:hypothetical protein